jgi:hypothetical protein
MKRVLSLAGACLVLVVFARSASAQWGTIKGRVVWAGDKLPAPEDLTELVMKNPDAAFCLKDGKVLDEKWVVDPKNKGIRWTFVWLAPEDPKGGKPLPIHPKLMKPAKKEVVLDQPVCMYMPHAVAMREGQDLVCQNNAKVAHNVLFQHPDIAGNPLVPPGKETRVENVKASKAPLKVSCSIHTWMSAWVRIFDHPYFAVTDADGSFEIKDAPAGKYRLVIWHSEGGWRGGALGRDGELITIEADKTTDLGEKKMKAPK